MQKTNGLQAKFALKLGIYIACVSLLGACVQIVGMDDPTLVDRLDEPSSSSSGAGGKETTSSSGVVSSSGIPAVSSSGNPGSSVSSGSTSGGGNSAFSAWAEWPMPNPTTASLPNPANYSVDSVSEVVLDLVTKLTWQRAIQVKASSYAEAKAYCESLVLAGQTGWRLPSRIELVSLVDFTKTSPAIDPAAFPGTPSSAFWTGSPKISMAMNEVWTVDFADGGTAAAAAETLLRVRCVR